MDSTLDKRGNPLNSRPIYWDTQLMAFFYFKCFYFMLLFYLYFFYVWRLFASLLSRPPGAKNHGKRNLLIQGRMQIFEKLSFWCISSPGTYLERCAVKFWPNFQPELLILKTKTFPLCKNIENLEFGSQCRILLAAPPQGPARVRQRPLDKGVSSLDFPFNNGFNPW